MRESMISDKKVGIPIGRVLDKTEQRKLEREAGGHVWLHNRGAGETRCMKKRGQALS